MNETEQTIQKVANIFSTNSFFTFPGYTEEDIAQEVWLICLDALEKYDDTRKASLYTYLYTVTNSRLINLRRDKYVRPDTNNLDKMKINAPESLDMEMSCNWRNMVEDTEIFELIEKEIPARLRRAWNCILDNAPIRPQDREEIAKIVEKYYEL